MTAGIKPLVKKIYSSYSKLHVFFLFFFIPLSPFILFFHSFSIPSFPQLILFSFVKRFPFFLPQIPFLFLLLMWLFSVFPFQLSELILVSSLYLLHGGAIEKLKVDCMGFSYFSFYSRGLFLFPAFSMKFTIPKCFLPFLPIYFTHLLLSCSVLQLPLHLLLLDI